MRVVGASMATASNLLALLVLSCQPGTDPTPGDDSANGGVGSAETAALSRALQAAGASVVRAETIPQSSSPFFAVDSTRLLVEGQNVWVWEYPSSAAAERDATLVSADGYQIGSSYVDWIGPPHFFHSSRLIVLYVGEDEAILVLLREALGPQFAGH